MRLILKSLFSWSSAEQQHYRPWLTHTLKGHHVCVHTSVHARVSMLKHVHNLRDENFHKIQSISIFSQLLNRDGKVGAGRLTTLRGTLCCPDAPPTTVQPLAETWLLQAELCPDMTIIHVRDVWRYLKRIINTPKCLPCLKLYFGRLSNPKIIPLQVSKYRKSELLHLSGCQWDIISCFESMLSQANTKIKKTFSPSDFKSHPDYGC